MYFTFSSDHNMIISHFWLVVPLTSVWLLEPSSFSLFICTHVCCHQLVAAVSSNPKQQSFVLFAEPGHVRRTVERFHRKSNNRKNQGKNSRYQSKQPREVFTQHAFHSQSKRNLLICFQWHYMHTACRGQWLVLLLLLLCLKLFIHTLHFPSAPWLPDLFCHSTALYRV